jgi:single-strand DNA-binding protein
MATRKTKTPKASERLGSSPAPDRAELTGRLVADPELRHTPTGKAVCNFRIAVNHDDGRAAEFHSCQSWGPLAETVIAKYARKGRLVTVKGRGRTDQYTGKDGVARTRTYLVVSTFRLISTPMPEAQTLEAS